MSINLGNSSGFSALRLLRMMVYEATHISDLTFRLERLDKLKPALLMSCYALSP
jgi:hypothetical protein